MRSVEALVSGAGQISLLTASHHNFPCWRMKQHLCWLPVITIVLMMTSSHHYCSHDDFQSSLLFPWWFPVITTLSTFKQHLCWLPVIIIVSKVTSSHHNKRNRVNPMWGANQHAVASRNYSHSCWLEVIGLLAHVRIKMSRPRRVLFSGPIVWQGVCFDPGLIPKFCQGL